MKLRRVFRTRTFSRWVLKNGLTNAALLQAVDEMAYGWVDADLGGHVFKDALLCGELLEVLYEH
jgi:hypothetical protein